MTPLTLITCTDDDELAKWMKEVEEDKPKDKEGKAIEHYVAELDDFEDEKAEVLNDQGPAFPYSKGMWLISLLVAVINPDDLDAIDEDTPFSKMTLDNLLGVTTTPQEYKHYFDSNLAVKKDDKKVNEYGIRETAKEKVAKYTKLYDHFANEKMVAKDIMEKFHKKSSSISSFFGSSTAPSTTTSTQDPRPAYTR